MIKEQQPAKVSYFFDKGYKDLGKTIEEAWKLNNESAANLISKVGEANVGIVKAMFGFSALCVYIFGTLFFLATTAVHTIVLASFFLLVYLMFFIVWLIDSIYIRLNKISTACPNSTCQSKFLIPTYECECGAKHTKLIPSKYGILKRKCECGNKLATTFLNGREKISAMCPECAATIDTGGKAVQLSVPVIGGTSVGKTCYVNMVVDKLINEIAEKRDWSINFNTEIDESNHKRAMESLSRGIRLEKTTGTNLTAYKFLVESEQMKLQRQIFIYDIAGEIFCNSDNIQSNRAYSHSDGFIFIIDPLSIPRFAMENTQLDFEAYGASTKDVDDILNITLVNLERMFNLKPKDILKKNLAVVINKCDIPGLNDIIGDEVAQEYVNKHEECKDFFIAKNEICKSFLENYEAGNFIRTAESKFNKVQYFTCSALGHNNEGKSYQSHGVEDALLWILESIDPKIRA